MNKHTAQLLEKHFDAAFAAPDGIKKLRELILTLAMQGKLVPQDPSDQPASELAKEIEVQSINILNSRKVKYRDITEDQDIAAMQYTIPDQWTWMRFRDAVFFQEGPGIRNWQFTSHGIKLLNVSNILFNDQLDLSNSDKYVSNEEFEIKYRHFEIEDGDLLFAGSGASWGKLAWYKHPGFKVMLNTSTMRLKFFHRSFCPNYLFYFLKGEFFKRQISLQLVGLQPNFGSTHMCRIYIPIPPIKEQHRIVAKIDELMSRCDELEKLRTAQNEKRLAVHTAAIKQLLNIAEPGEHRRAQAFLAKHFGELYTVKENVAELRKAILQLAVMGKLVPQDPNDPPASELLKEIEAEKLRLFKEGKIKMPKPLPPVTEQEKPYALPRGWEWVRLGALANFIDYRGKTPNKTDCGVPLITAKNIRQGYINREPQEFISHDEYRKWMTRGFPKIGDLLFTTEAPLGNVAIVDISGDFALAQRAICFSIYRTEISKFLKWLIMSQPIQDLLIRNATGMTATGIKAARLKELLFPIPPLFEQNRIVKKIDELMRSCDTLDQKIDATNHKQTELLNALLNAKPKDSDNIIDLATYRSSIGCYAVNKLANEPYFGRTAAAKVLYLAQAHIGLKLDFHPEREAAGPLDKWIYEFEKQGKRNGWFAINEKPTKAGYTKYEYKPSAALKEPAKQAENLMTQDEREQFDQLTNLLRDRNTEEVEIIATLFAVWNDFLIDGVKPTDEQIITELRENWHERKKRFTPTELGKWLNWMRREKLIPRGLPPRTVQQPKLKFH